MYYDDMNIKVIVHHFFQPDNLNSFYTHVNSIEFIRSGQMKVVCCSDNKTLHLIGPAIYWLHKNNTYEYSDGSDEHSGKFVEHLYCDFTGERSERILSALDELFPDGFFIPHAPDNVTEDFFKLLKLYRIDPVGNLPEIGFIIEKLVSMAYQSSRKNTINYDDRYELDKIAEKLRSEPFDDYDFCEIAAEKGLSPDHFRRLFRNRHNLTPGKYLFHQRMIRAAELLEFDNVSIKEIVYSCRFKSFVDFSRSFRKFSGLSPRQYRSKVRSKSQ